MWHTSAPDRRPPPLVMRSSSERPPPWKLYQGMPSKIKGGGQQPCMQHQHNAHSPLSQRSLHQLTLGATDDRPNLYQSLSVQEGNKRVGMDIAIIMRMTQSWPGQISTHVHQAVKDLARLAIACLLKILPIMTEMFRGDVSNAFRIVA